MSVIKCAECGGNVSTYADICPHCGFPTSKTKNCSTSCSILGQAYDMSEVLDIARQGNTPRNRVFGCRTIQSITGMEIWDAKGLWDIIVSQDAIPASFTILKKEHSVPQPNIPKCPTCGSTKLTKQGAASRGLSGFFFGRHSVEGRAQWICQDCGYMW